MSLTRGSYSNQAPSDRIASGSGSAVVNSDGSIGFLTNSTSRWSISTSGHILAATDNTYDIGASGATRPRSIYAGTSLAVGSAGSLAGDASNILSLRNSTSAQAFRVYNTYTDGSNGEWGALRWNSNVLEVMPYANGTGTVRSLQVGSTGAIGLRTSPSSYHIDALATTVAIGASVGGTARTDVTNKLCYITQYQYANANINFLVLGSISVSGANTVVFGGGTSSYNAATGLEFYTAANQTTTTGTLRWQINSSGHLLAGSDNAYDIGATGATRPRNIFPSSSVVMKTKAGALADGDFTNPADGMFGLDTTNHRFYVRDGGVWKYAALT